MEDSQTCQNCKKVIPVQKSASHFGYCRRNIIKCTVCQEMYDKNFLEEHEDEFHKTDKCQHCSVALKKSEHEVHVASCLMKPKFCEYCELNVPSREYQGHLKQCESRTTPCSSCEKSILNKEMAVHAVSCRGKEKISKPEFKMRQNPEYSQYDETDSLSMFSKKQQKVLKDTKDKKDQKPVKGIEREKGQIGKKQVKSQIKPTSKKESISEKKEVKDPQEISRQQFYNNYFGNSSDLSEFGIYDGDLYQPQNFDQRKKYQPQAELYDGDSFNFSRYGRQSFTHGFGLQSQIDPEEQFFQQTLLQSAKPLKNEPSSNFKDHLPPDFFSEDIMSKSFYKDILQIEKQKAILEDLAKNKKPKARGRP